MKIRLFLICFLFIQPALFSQKNDTIGITFQNSGELIILYNNGTFIYKIPHCDICPSFGKSDVISYGRYVKHKNKMYYLFSSPDIGSSEVDVSVEEMVREREDSLTIELFSPFETEAQESPYLRKAIFYQIVIYYDIDSIKKLIDIQNSLLLSHLGINIGENNVCYTLPQTFWNNKLTIYKPKGFPIKSIQIKIYPTINYFINYPFFLSNYQLENPYSNYLKIFMPQFTYQRFCYKYFYYKDIEIINSNTIRMDGNLLWKSDVLKKKEDLPQKRYVKRQYRWWEINDPYRKEYE